MHLDSSTHRELLGVSSHLATKNHAHYLSEALTQIKRNLDDPIAALELLIKMFGSAFANRENERAALTEVGVWLENRLYKDPDITGRQLSLELGWLRRLVIYHQKIGNLPRARPQHQGHRGGTRHQGHRGGAKHQGHRGGARHQARRGQAARPGFGRKLHAIRVARERLLKAPPQEPVKMQELKPSIAPPAKTRVVEPPARFSIVCHSAGQAWKIWQTTRTRLRKAKPIKDKPFRARPEDPNQLPNELNIELSFLSSRGLIEAFQSFPAKLTSTTQFVVESWVREGNTLRVTQISSKRS